MGKSSQLLQLKSALSQAGINRTPRPKGTKRKRSGALGPDKDEKTATLSQIHQKLNPFDVKVTKLKHDAGGRKIKGVAGKPARTKQAGLEQRKKTLLKEYQEKDRSGKIVDRRFGENDPTMTPEDRMLERFIRERQRTSRGTAFNLEDEDELTHYGQKLSTLDDFGDVGLGVDDDEDRGQIDGGIVQASHFGGFDDETDDEQPARKKSKAEVMAEVMSKSKEHKLQRQMEREQGENIRHELDKEFDSLRSLLYNADPSSSGRIPGPSDDGVENDSLSTAIEEDDEYDQHVRELAFDKRAKAKDRTKTAEEIALEEKEALEKAERQRQRRMLGEDEVGSDTDVDKNQGKRKRKRGGDDLEDDFDDDREEWHGLGTGLGEDSIAEEPSDSDGDESRDDSGPEDDDSESGSSKSEDDDDDVSSAEDDEGDSGNERFKSKDLIAKTRKPASKPSTQDLPFTFECPSSLAEFLDIVEGVDDKDVPTVIHRIRTLYHPSLAPDNKQKLQTLVSVLVDHILYITSPPNPRITLLSSLLPHLFALTRSYPTQSAEAFVRKLSLMQKNLKRGLSHDPLAMDARTWPGLSELLFLRTIGVIWPTSDLNHPVISPARVLMGSYLGLARVRSLPDIASGLFLCTLALQFEELSKRFVPEAINFVANAVLHLAPHDYKDIHSIPGSFPCPDFLPDFCRPLFLDVKASRNLTAKKPDLVNVLSKDHDDCQTRVDLLGLSFDLLGRFADLYKSLEGFPELFEPLRALLTDIHSNKLPESLQIHAKAAKDAIDKLLKFAKEARRPLLLQSHKPIPIPTYIPKFELTSSSYLRNRDPDRERNEAAKLRKQVKQERKGAIRELRKDARFLAAVQQKEQTEKDMEYNKRMKRVFGSLESERAEQKAMEKEKTKLKKRAGRLK